MIKIIRTKYYKRNIQSNKVEYSTDAGLYCTAHDVKVMFCVPEFSSSNIIEHHFHVDNRKSELGIGYAATLSAENPIPTPPYPENSD